jgi:drug/metabolite transporter (DMT)-like permease
MTVASPPTAKAIPRGVVVPFVLIVAVWSSTWYVIKDQIGLAQPSWTVVARFIVASAGMAVLALLRGESLRLPRAAWPTIGLLGLTQFCLNFQFVYRAELSLTSGIMAIIMALVMIPTALLARVLFGAPVDRRFIAGSAVAVLGIGLLLLHEYRAAPPGAAVLSGLAYGFAAVLSVAVATVLQLSRGVRDCPPIPLMAVVMAVGTLINLGWALAQGGPLPTGLPPRFWGGVVYLAIVCSVVPFPLYVNLIRRIGAGRAAYVNVAIPVFAMVISTVLEAYRWTPLAASGALLAMAGLLIVMRARG